MSDSLPDLAQLAQSIKDWGRELGFQQVGITGVELGEHEAHLQRWLEAGYQGEMDYMAAHGSKRSHSDELVPGTLRVVSLRMDYLPGDTRMAERLALQKPMVFATVMEGDPESGDFGEPKLIYFHGDEKPEEVSNMQPI